MSAQTDIFSCILLGEDSLAIQCGEMLQRAGHGIKAVVTRSPAIERWARDENLHLIPGRDDLTRALDGVDFDYLFSITNLAIVPDDVLRLAKRAAINFHDGPLPRYAGLYTPAWAIMNREVEYGISFHEMSAGVDEGDLLVQVFFDLSPGETSLTLNTKCFEAGMDAFGQLIEQLSTGSVEASPQDLSQKTTFLKFDRPAAAAVLDWRQPAEELAALVRALDFGRYENPLAAAKLHHEGEVFVVRTAEAVTSESVVAPGTLIEADKDGVLVASSTGALRLGGLATPFGQEVPALEVMNRLGVGRGEQLEIFDDNAAAELTDLNAKLCRSEAFWVRRLAALQPLDLPYIHSERASAGSKQKLEALRFEVPPTFLSRWAEGPEGGADAVLAAVTGLMARISGETTFHLAFRDSALTTLAAGAEKWLASHVPLFARVPVDTTVAAALDATRKELRVLRKHGTYLKDAVGRFPSLAENPVLARGDLLPVAVEICDSEKPVSATGVDLLVRISPDASTLSLIYDGRVVAQNDAEALENQLGLYLQSMAEAQAESKLSELSLLTTEEAETLLHDWNRTATDYPRDRCVHELFSEQVEKTPDATAVVFEDDSYTYRELDRRANQLAHYLRGVGVSEDDLVGVYLERSLEMMVSVLAVHKAGGAYVPLDPAYPSDRIALMIEDSETAVVIAQDRLIESLPPHNARVVRVDTDWRQIESEPETSPDTDVGPSNLAYVIYTSGSTGRPKGVMVEHRNVVNFFAGMDQCIQRDANGVWLAVTSLSFDISVLELFWTLARGFKVVIYDDDRGAQANEPPARPMDFGFFMWGSDDAQGSEKYDLMLESAKFGDRNGFSSIWTPERHFHAFGGPYPNPSITAAAIAAVTDRISIRAGSCVLPLHHPIRVAEEWAVVDNLSKGRVALSIASGWQVNDFVLRPESFEDAKGVMLRDIETLRSLWRGEELEFENPRGEKVAISTRPRPIQKELPLWVTAAGNPETFREAGAIGANVLTHLLGQSLPELHKKIRVYRDARKEAGLDPSEGIVTLMLHTLVAETDEQAREVARGPMKSYLGTSVALVKSSAWDFPAFKRPDGQDSTPDDIDLGALGDDEMDEILEFAFERYFATSGLFGSVETCLGMVDRVKAIDVDEIGCLIDYGIPTETVLSSLDSLNRVRELANSVPENATSSNSDHSLRAQVERHKVTHLQCTPSMARMLVLDEDSKPALGKIEHLLIGGEAFPLSLAHDLDGVAGGTVTNMYGPTETTIWSSSAAIVGKPESITIGRPIANTQMYILDAHAQPAPVGVAGELMIGGDGVVRGYHNRAELTADRFISDRFSDCAEARLYRTGDLARYNPDGTIDFLGRLDHQVKIRGHRVELGEIEARISQYEAIRECVAVVREDIPGDQRLVAYLVCQGKAPDTASLTHFLGETLPDFMVPGAFCFLDFLPLTPNGKIDRKSLPAPEQASTRARSDYQEPGNQLERQIAEVWQNVLKIDGVGVKDNFFDLGGHSLLVVQMHRGLREFIETPLSLTDLYRYPSIEALVERLEGDHESSEKAEAEGRNRAEKRRAAMANRRRRRKRA